MEGLQVLSQLLCFRNVLIGRHVLVGLKGLLDRVVSTSWQVVDPDDLVLVAFKDWRDWQWEGVVVRVEFIGVHWIAHVEEDLE